MEYVIGFWIVCGIVGAIIGASKDSSGIGFILGLLLGPLGVLAAFAVDGRAKCVHCHGRLNGKPEICQHCNATLFWSKPENSEDGKFGVRCSNCKRPLQIGIEVAGESFKCAACGKIAVAQTYVK